MANTFLIQINARSYDRLMKSQTYQNELWSKKRRDSAQGEVEFGDTILFYCTADVPQYGQSLALRAPIESFLPDKFVLHLGEVKWFRSPLPRDRIRELVAAGELEDAFKSCGAQGFNIAKLGPESFAKIIALVETEQGPGQAPTLRRTGPLDALIEAKLEDYIVQNWDRIDFGANLRIYRENGEDVGQQYDTKEIGIIDLLCEDEDSGDLVIIELKKGRPADEVAGQLARYMGWAREKIAQGRKIKGIILAPDFDARLRYAAKAIPGVALLKYEIKFEIRPEQLT